MFKSSCRIKKLANPLQAKRATEGLWGGNDEQDPQKLWDWAPGAQLPLLCRNRRERSTATNEFASRFYDKKLKRTQVGNFC